MSIKNKNNRYLELLQHLIAPSMNAEGQAFYLEHYNAAVREGWFEALNPNFKKFIDYLSSANLSNQNRTFLEQRVDMHKIIGNNQDYLGNGVTKALTKSKKLFGAVETLNFERREITLATLLAKDAIKIIELLEFDRNV